VVVPPYKPVVSVTSGSFYRNKATLSDTPDWEILICKDNLFGADETDFMTVKRYNHKTGNYDGVAFYFYHDIPTAGRRRVTGGWVYGYNLDSKILQEYATLKVCEKVILARLFSGNPMNLASFTGGDINSYVNTQYEAQLAWIAQRCEKLEKDHFPTEVPIATMQGI